MYVSFRIIIKRFILHSQVLPGFVTSDSNRDRMSSQNPVLVSISIQQDCADGELTQSIAEFAGNLLSRNISIPSEEQLQEQQNKDTNIVSANNLYEFNQNISTKAVQCATLDNDSSEINETDQVPIETNNDNIKYLQADNFKSQNSPPHCISKCPPYVQPSFSKINQIKDKCEDLCAVFSKSNIVEQISPYVRVQMSNKELNNEHAPRIHQNISVVNMWDDTSENFISESSADQPMLEYAFLQELLNENNKSLMLEQAQVDSNHESKDENISVKTQKKTESPYVLASYLPTKFHHKGKSRPANSTVEDKFPLTHIQPYTCDENKCQSVDKNLIVSENNAFNNSPTPDDANPPPVTICRTRSKIEEDTGNEYLKHMSKTTLQYPPERNAANEIDETDQLLVACNIDNIDNELSVNLNTINSVHHENCKYARNVPSAKSKTNHDAKCKQVPNASHCQAPNAELISPYVLLQSSNKKINNEQDSQSDFKISCNNVLDYFPKDISSASGDQPIDQVWFRDLLNNENKKSIQCEQTQVEANLEFNTENNLVETKKNYISPQVLLNRCPEANPSQKGKLRCCDSIANDQISLIHIKPHNRKENNCIGSSVDNRIQPMGSLGSVDFIDKKPTLQKYDSHLSVLEDNVFETVPLLNKSESVIPPLDKTCGISSNIVSNKFVWLTEDQVENVGDKAVCIPGLGKLVLLLNENIENTTSKSTIQYCNVSTDCRRLPNLLESCLFEQKSGGTCEVRSDRSNPRLREHVNSVDSGYDLTGDADPD